MHDSSSYFYFRFSQRSTKRRRRNPRKIRRAKKTKINRTAMKIVKGRRLTGLQQGDTIKLVKHRFEHETFRPFELKGFKLMILSISIPHFGLNVFKHSGIQTFLAFRSVQVLPLVEI